ncbi:MAG: sulfurtransferase [Rhodobacteraceae bacterium]|nr:sulfurtransferase [Paracoccaceae bacterium]
MFSFRKPSVPAIDPRDAVRRVGDGSLTLIDIRDHSELTLSGRAAGATHIPLMVLPMKADPSSPEFHPDLSLDKPVALYCASGARSGMAARMLRKMGFREVYNLGGLYHWQTAGGSITH